MSTDNQQLNTIRGFGSRLASAQGVALVVSGANTVTGQIPVPPGSWLSAVRIETPAAISGVPTSCLVRVGVTAAGQEVVADVDGKGLGHINATLVASYDPIGNATATYFVQVTTAGGTAPAGTINVIAHYNAPVV